MQRTQFKSLTSVNVDIVLVIRFLNVGVDPGHLGGREGLHRAHQTREKVSVIIIIIIIIIVT